MSVREGTVMSLALMPLLTLAEAGGSRLASTRGANCTTHHQDKSCQCVRQGIVWGVSTSGTGGIDSKSDRKRWYDTGTHT